VQKTVRLRLMGLANAQQNKTKQNNLFCLVEFISFISADYTMYTNRYNTTVPFNFCASLHKFAEMLCSVARVRIYPTRIQHNTLLL